MHLEADLQAMEASPAPKNDPGKRPGRDELDSLPEQTPFLPDDDELPDDGDGTELLQGLDADPDLDDSNAADLDPGIELDDDEADSLAGELEGSGVDAFDVLEGREAAPIVQDDAADTQDTIPDDDAFGVRNIGTFSIEDGDDAPSDAGFDDLIDEDLPGLDADDGEEGAIADALFDTAIVTAEEPPRRADLMWGEIPLSQSETPRTVVRIAGNGAIAAGRDVAVVDEAGARRLIARDLQGTVSSAVVDAAPSTLLYTTTAGALFRVGLSDSSPEPLVAYRDAVGSLSSSNVGSPELTLGGPTKSARPALLLHVGGAAPVLLESTDHGKTWRRVELGGAVLALSAGTPPACLVATERGTRLYRSEPSGGFTAIGAVWPSDTVVPSLATNGDIVAVLEPGAPVRVSADGGATFRAASGTSSATAITAGRIGSRPWAFAALFDSTSGRASLVAIDAATADAFVIAYLEPRDDEDDDDVGSEDASRIVSLAWDASEETLWAAGEFGLTRFRRPPSA